MTKRQQHVTIARIMQSLWDTKRAFGGYPAQPWRVDRRVFRE